MVALSRPATTVNRVLSTQHTYATDFFLKLWYDSILKCILDNSSRKNNSASSQKCVWPYFHPVANKRLIYTIMTTSRINLMAQLIFLHTKLCKTYRVYCLNYILNESQVNMKDSNFVTSLLRCDQLFLEWAQIIKYFYTHCKLLKIMIRDMLFPTKLTPLINTQGLIDSASLKKSSQ